MAPVSGNMKGFYRQRKMANKSTKSSNKKKSRIPASTLTHADYYNEDEEVLGQFDMNMAYGPCIGVPRIARWERAHNLGLNPPQEILRLLKSGKVPSQGLWDSRI